MKMHKLVLLAVVSTWAMGALAQWQWIDKDGRKVFSDRPPPQEIPQKNILKQPGGNWTGRPPAVAASSPLDDPASAPVSPAARPASGAKLPASASGTGIDKELEQRKAQADAAEAAKKKAEEEKVAKGKAENCARAQQAKTVFDSGKPVTQSNAQGERIFLDEAARTAELKRIQAIIQSSCNP